MAHHDDRGRARPAFAVGLIAPETLDAGVHPLHRMTETDDVFCYTFFKGVGERLD